MSGDQPSWMKLMAPPTKVGQQPIVQNTWLHLGGTPQAPIGLINGVTGSQGFTGCLHSLKINGRSQEIHRYVSEGSNSYGATHKTTAIFKANKIKLPCMRVNRFPFLFCFFFFIQFEMCSFLYKGFCYMMVVRSFPIYFLWELHNLSDLPAER